MRHILTRAKASLICRAGALLLLAACTGTQPAGGRRFT